MNYRGVEIRRETRYVTAATSKVIWCADVDGRVLDQTGGGL